MDGGSRSSADQQSRTLSRAIRSRSRQKKRRLVAVQLKRHGSDPAISQQLLAAAADRFDNGDVRRMRKLDRTRPIDAAVRWRSPCRVRRSSRRRASTTRGD
jgi:hypothetical protein